MMAPKAIGFGIALILIGAIGYFSTGTYSWTAWIPAFIGAPLLIFGLIGLKENLRKHAMHGAVLVALLGALGSLGKLIPGLLKGTGSPAAQMSQGLTAVLCAIFVFLCVRSFIAARKAREASNT
jgi:hypothetical protein